MNKKCYCSISNHVLSKEVSSDKLNYQTYKKLLDNFDEIHIYGRTYDNKSYVKKDESLSIYMHYVSVPKNYLLKYIITIVKMYFTILKDNKKYGFSIFDASEPTTGGIIGSLLKIVIKKPFLLQVQGELTRISSKTNGMIFAFGSKHLTLFCTKFATKIRVVSNVIKKQLIEDETTGSNVAMVFKDDKIIKHVDKFNFWRWSRQSLGPVGLVLGWTPMLRKKVGAMANENLTKFIKKQA